MEQYILDRPDYIIAVTLSLFLVIRVLIYFKKHRFENDDDDDGEGGILNPNDYPLPDLPPGVVLSVDERELA